MNFRSHTNLLFSVLILFLITSLTVSCTEKTTLQTLSLIVETKTGTSIPLVVEVAQSSAEQEMGFMGRKTIPDGTGMLFVYKTDRQMHFWMKNTPHALSIAFIDSQGVIREIRNMTPHSLETISSERSVRYALEVPIHWFEQTQIRVGDTLKGVNPETSLSSALTELQ